MAAGGGRDAVEVAPDAVAQGAARCVEVAGARGKRWRRFGKWNANATHSIF